VMVCEWFGLKITQTVSPVWPQNRWVGFLGLDLKTGSCGLVIWASKSPRWFFGLGLKTKQASVCQLCHKIDGGRMTCDTSQDLVACFAWKQVALGFSSLAKRPAEARRRMVHVAPSWRLHQDQVEDKWIDVMGCVGPYYPYFTILLSLRDIVIF
jgi:hypothetical protein